MYGVAANRRWHSAAIDQVMKKRYADKYQNIPIPMVSDPESDPRDKDYTSEEMLRAMDDMPAFSMFIKGNTFESLVAQRQKREELAEARVQEAGRLKAERWINATWPSVCSLSP